MVRWPLLYIYFSIELINKIVFGYKVKRNCKMLRMIKNQEVVRYLKLIRSIILHIGTIQILGYFTKNLR